MKSCRVRAAARRAGPIVAMVFLPLAPATIPLAGPSTIAAQEPSSTVLGRVLTAEGQPVRAAEVALVRVAAEASPTDPRGALIIARTLTDAGGRFRMVAPPGEYRIRGQAFGHAPTERALVLVAGEVASVTLELDPGALALEGLTVRGRRDRSRFEEEAGATVTELSGEDLRRLPGTAEGDVLRAIEVMPGVISTSDFSAAFNVRGGAADQNLILLDGIPIYNPFHLGGVFSVFNADMVERAELVAGGFPARYGGRVSSVLNVRSDPGDGTPSLDAGVSVLAARAAVGVGLPAEVAGRLGFDRVDARVAVRRSYLDVLLAPVVDFPYRLNDFQGVARGWTRNGVLTVTGYVGDDVLDLRQTPDFPLPVRLGWGNDAVGARWAGRSGETDLEVRGSTSAFASAVDFPDFDDTRIYTGIREWRTGFDATRDFRWAAVGGGLEAAHIGYDNRLESGGTVFRGGSDDGWLAAAYLQLGLRSADWLLELGARLDGWNAASAPLSLEPAPRLAVKRFLAGGDAAVKLAVGRYTQALHSLRDEEVPIGIDLWVTAGARAPVLVSDQVQAGYERFGDGWSGAVEAYYRHFDGVVTTNPAADPGDPLDAFLAGTGRSWGADVVLRRDPEPGRRLDGWLTVSWLRATRTFPDAVRPDAEPTTYPPIFDRRVDLDLVLRYPLPGGIDGGLRFNLGTGLPYTRPVGAYTTYSYRLGDGKMSPPAWGEDGTAPRSVVLGPRNAERYPAYHRLDLSMRREFRRGWGSATPYLDLINVYDRRNVLFYFYDYGADPPVRAGISMLPVVPTVGIEVSF
jgi:hypothetical protein